MHLTVIEYIRIYRVTLLQVKEAKEDLEAEREDLEGGFFKRSFEYACTLGQAIGVEPSIPRVAARQMHRANAEAITVEEHYRRNVGIPFLDHLITGIESRFDKYGIAVHQMNALVPSVIVAREVSIEDYLMLYKDDVPSPGKL